MGRLFLIVVLERCRYGYNDPTRKPRKNVLALSGPCYLCLSVHRQVPRLSPTLFLLIPFVHRRQPTFSHSRRREVNEIRVQVRKKGKERKKRMGRKEKSLSLLVDQGPKRQEKGTWPRRILPRGRLKVEKEEENEGEDGQWYYRGKESPMENLDGRPM